MTSISSENIDIIVMTTYGHNDTFFLSWVHCGLNRGVAISATTIDFTRLGIVGALLRKFYFIFLLLFNYFLVFFY